MIFDSTKSTMNPWVKSKKFKFATFLRNFGFSSIFSSQIATKITIIDEISLKIRRKREKISIFAIFFVLSIYFCMWKLSRIFWKLAAEKLNRAYYSCEIKYISYMLNPINTPELENLNAIFWSAKKFRNAQQIFEFGEIFFEPSANRPKPKFSIWNFGW